MKKKMYNFFFKLKKRKGTINEIQEHKLRKNSLMIRILKYFRE